ncbi:MAG: hypothetical protein IJU40_05270 [Desulfovibrionaceae bacterium]|nr:hypothetical protein [Desulfovibrionaceae bacterium]
MLSTLINLLHKISPLAIAYSGGLDSRFLCHIAKLYQVKFIALQAIGPHIPSLESQQGKLWAQKEGIDLYQLEISPLEELKKEQFGTNRCYFCKILLFSRFKDTLNNLNKLDYTLCDGTNFDDLKVYRPGIKALSELKIRSPLKEVNLGKKDIRKWAETTGLTHPSQTPSPCLLTRISYDLLPTVDLLKRIDQAETEVKAYLKKYYQDLELRIRVLPTFLLQITPFSLDLKKEIKPILQKYNLDPCYLYITSKISGFFDGDRPDLSSLPLI